MEYCVCVSEVPLRFVGTCFLNCHQPQSEGIDQLCTILQEVSIPEFSATHTRYTALFGSYLRSNHPLQPKQCSCRISQLGSSATRIAYLEHCQPQKRCMCQDLSVAGLALYLSNKKDLPRVGWYWTFPAFSTMCMGSSSSQNPKRLSLSLVSFTVITWTGSSQTWI